jgi:hypothetical protein
MVGTVILLLIILAFVVLEVVFLHPRPRHPAGSPGARGQMALIGLAVAAATAPAIFFLYVPVYSSGRTLVEVNGSDAAPALIIPIVLTAIPALSRRPDSRTRVCASLGVLLSVLCFIGGFSIGFFYVPAALLLVAAAAVGGCVRRASLL